MKIVVLAGGLSPERDVSLSSGALIANALIENGHDVLLLDLYYGVNSPDFEAVYRNKRSGFTFAYSVPEKEPDLDEIRKDCANGGSLIGEGVLELCKAADVVFLALHGSIGENGRLQALLDIYGIGYTGTGYAGSLLAMDKDISKKMLRSNGIATADWRCVSTRDDINIDEIKLPCVVKPCGCGSSVGVTIAETAERLREAIDYAGNYEDRIILEEKVEGREFSVGVLDGEALPPIEIIPKTGFYDYKNKYQAGLTVEVCPAEIPPETTLLLQSSALAVHKALGLGFYSRIDFILDRNGSAVCLEANTLPGMTPTSLLPQEANAVGITYNALCEKIAHGRVTAAKNL